MDIEFESLAILDRKIIVGIDFGTTFSGIAWAETHRHDRRSAITSWPVSKTILAGETSEKVPTRLWYNKNKTEWGFTIPPAAPAEEIIEWFKL
jgi:molecular chaperone DnaK (HSP70)